MYMYVGRCVYSHIAHCSPIILFGLISLIDVFLSCITQEILLLLDVHAFFVLLRAANTVPKVNCNIF